MLSKWDERYLDLAAHVSTWSKDPSTKVGAVLISNNHVVSLGFNGFPYAIDDNDRLNDRSIKYEMIIHGEINALLNVDGRAFDTLYTHPFLPCSRCAAIYLQAGIMRVVAPRNTDPRWAENLELTKSMFTEAGVDFLEV